MDAKIYTTSQSVIWLKLVLLTRFGKQYGCVGVYRMSARGAEEFVIMSRRVQSARNSGTVVMEVDIR